MRALFRKIRDSRFRHETLITIFIHRERILHNLLQFQKMNPDVNVAPVLKSNAYGHGLVHVAHILMGQSLPFLCVDSYVEALILRNEGIHTPLVILGYTPLENIERSRLKNVSFSITSMEELRRLDSRCRLPAQAGKNVAIHLKIDTGMHRQGIFPEELTEALGIMAQSKKIVLDGAYSHLADADTPKSALTKKQIGRWNAAAHEIREKIPSVRYFHLANTAGSRYSKEIDANVMRLGIGLYGIDPHTKRGYAPSTQNSVNPRSGVGVNLLPALEMKTRITSVRKIAAGESVGYNATFTAKREMIIATIPVGYAEGLDRRLSNPRTRTASLSTQDTRSPFGVGVKNIICPVVGRVNMNITSIDISRVPDPKIDDEVLVVSADRGAPNSIENMAKLCGTIPYEFLIRLPAQIRRVVCP